MYLHFLNRYLNMKKYLIPLPLIFATFFFVWKKQDIEISYTTEQAENSESDFSETETPETTSVLKKDRTGTEIYNQIAPQVSSAKIADDIRPSPSQAPPVRPKVIEIIEEVKMATVESVIKPSTTSGLDTRISLVRTSMKHPMMMIEEKGEFFGKPNENVESVNAHVATHFMLQVRPGINLLKLEEKIVSLGCVIGEKLTDETFIVNLNQEASIDEHFAVKEALTDLTDLIEVVEPDYFVYAIKTPNDSRLLDLWGMHNSGQSGGTSDKDIDGLEAWDLQTGSKDVLVGVIDTGIDGDHEDLKANMWTNPNEIPGNGKDDDGNGYIDDVNGWDFYNNDNNPYDDNSHGTHCAGTIGGVGNNGKGVVGVCWETSMVGIKFLGGSGGGYLSDGVKSIAYATKIGVNLTSNSWGGGGYSSSMKKAIDEAASQGIGFIAAAGNHAGNNDKYPSYPASYESENVISVGANDHKGRSAYFSCYGKNSVDLFAPGVNTLSTTPGNRYASFSGTSMATPHVAGAYALVLSANPSWNVHQVKDALMKGVDPENTLSEKCVTGGRLNVFQALSNDAPNENLIAVKPTKLDFGPVSKNQSIELEFVLSNPGNTDTIVNAVYIDASSKSPNNLIGKWDLDGNAQDSSGHGHHGQVLNATPTIDRFGNPNQAYAFDGDGDYIEITHADTLNTLPISVSVWFNASEKNERGGIISKYIAAHWNGWQIATYNNRMKPWYLRNHYHGVIGEHGEDPFETDFSYNTWNHIVTIFDEEGGQIYKNGNFIDSHNWRGAPGKCSTNTSLQIGRYRTYDPSKHPHSDFNGAIDDVRIYGSSLSEEEVLSLYNNDTGDSSFSVSLETPLTLEPYSSQIGKIKFSSDQEGIHQASLILESDAQNDARLVVPLQAEVTTTPELAVDPESLHYGLLEGETKTQSLTLSNLGDGDLTYELTVSGSDKTKNRSAWFAPGENEAPDADEMFTHPHVEGELIVGFKPGHSSFSANEVEGLNLRKNLNPIGMRRGLSGATPPPQVLLYSTSDKKSLKAMRNNLLADPRVAYVEPNYLMDSASLPNDPSFEELWGLENTGQKGGTPGADVSVLEAWEVHQGSAQREVVVGIIDSGVDFEHPDLQGTQWVNPAEIPDNGIDDDENGYIDDVHGFNFIDNIGEVTDGHGHGTHNASTFAAKIDNGKGIAGYSINVRVASLQFLNSAGSGSISNAIEALNYANAMGISVTCNSWGGGGYSQALKDALDAAGEKGYIFVTSAGNNNRDITSSKKYPICYTSESVIGVGSTDRQDNLADYSNWSATHVDLVAPGVSYAAWIGDTYQWNQGTSNCAPQVVGAIALLKSYNPELTGPEIKQILLDSVDPLPSLEDKVLSQGRLNLYKVLGTQKPHWLTLGTTNGKVKPEGEAIVEITAIANRLPGSSAEAFIIVRSNDSGNPVKRIRVTAELLDAKNGLVFHPSSLSFQETFVGQTAKEVLEITNSSTETITIQRFAFRSSAFSHHLTLPHILEAGEKASTMVYFTPKEAGNLTSSALILTDDKNGKVRSLAVQGKASIAPILSMNPMSVSESLGMNEEKTLSLQVRNLGGSVLNWSLTGATAQGGKSLTTPAVFNKEHFASLNKGSLDQRSGAPISALGGGPDYHGYSWADSKDAAGPDHNWTDISKTGTLLSTLSDMDDGFVKLTLPFAMEFYGTKSSEVFVNSNGYLTFGEGSLEHGHFPLPTRMMPGKLVAPFAMDLNPSRGGKIYFQASPDEFIIQYDQVKDFAGLGEYTFQVSLNRNGVIYFHYETMEGATNRSTTGIQNESRDIGLLVGYNNEQIQPNSTIRIATSPKWLHTSKIAGSLEAGQMEDLILTLKAGAILAGQYVGSIEVSSNDPEQANVLIPVRLTIEATRRLAATPIDINFEEAKVGTTEKHGFVLVNEGNAPIEVSKLEIRESVFSSNCQSCTLKPGDRHPIEVYFQPTEGKTYQASAKVIANAENSPLSLNLKGIGLASPKLQINPEIVQITLEAGQNGTELAVIDNLEGQAQGTFELKEIRSAQSGRAGMGFNEKSESSSESIPDDPFAAEHSPNELIVSFKAGKKSFEDLSKLGSGFRVERALGTARIPGQAGQALDRLSMVLILADENSSLRKLAARLEKDPAVDFAEPNYILRHSEVPNDPDWQEQWALPKIQAPEAWKISKNAPSVIVAVIDTGIDYSHPDLQGNLWTNPGEVPGNGRDDDGNGYIDDIHGWDFCNKDNDPMDGNLHGTHVAGTIAAATNNGKQVAGVAWQTQLMALKFLSDSGWGSVADAVDAVAYCVAMEVPISNNSWGGGGYSQAMKDVIEQAGEKGHLFCAAAGNSANDNDQRAFYPASYDCQNVLSVAASNNSDELAYFSCYGKTTVDLAAPGVNIFNLSINGGTTSLSGTSMASPHVAGAAALLLGQNPSAGHQEIKNTLINTVDPIESFRGKMVAGGRLNLFNAVESFGPNWLTVTPERGTVEAGGKTELTFAIDASNLVAGTKKAIVAYRTNDPLAETIEIPVHLTVTGQPKIEVNPKHLSFGEVWVGKKVKRSITILNSGTDVLEINEISFGHVAFSTEVNATSLKPRQEMRLEVIGAPLTSESITSRLLINSNDQDQSTLEVTLEMEAVLPPSLSYSPDLVSMILEPGQTTESLAMISNLGEATGNWKARLVETNKKKSRNRNLDGILTTLNEDGRSPDFSNPGYSFFQSNKNSENEKDEPDAIRYDGSNAEFGIEVAILGADAASELKKFGEAISELESISGVTTINVSALTPKLEELKVFDAVIVYSNYAYRDNQALGDVIAEYTELGGGVVTMNGENILFANSENWSLGGKWKANDYSIFEPESQYSRESSDLGEIKMPSHPLINEVKSFKGLFRISHSEAKENSSLVASWEGGSPLVTFRNDMGAVVDLNFFPTHDQWEKSTDGMQLIENALNWTSRDDSPKWILGAPLSGSVNGASEGSLTLSFDSTDLEEGNYSAEIQFSSNDPENPYDIIKVALTVRENQPPVAKPDSHNLLEDSSLAFSLRGTDPDGDKLTYHLVKEPINGTLSGKAPSLTYSPKPNFNGSDELTFKVSDGRKESQPAKILFEIEAVNDNPWANPVEINATEDDFVLIDFQYGDPDGDSLALTITQEPTHGFLWEESGQWLYIPGNHYNGSDSLHFEVSDGGLKSEETKITIQLEPANDAPVANDLSIATDENLSANITLEASDIDGDELTYTIVDQPSHGLLTKITGNKWSYKPFDHYFGTDLFTYRANDGQADGNLATVSIEIIELNQAPVVEESTFSLQEDGTLPIKLVASDPDGDSLTFTISQEPANGMLEGEGPSYEYTPNQDFNGIDSFLVVANDGELDSNLSLITLIIEGKNDAPKFVRGIVTMASGLRETPFRMKVDVEDVDNDELTLTIAKGPQNGDCYFDEQNLVYLPKPGFEGLEEIILELSDGKESVQNTFPISIASHQDPIHIHFDKNQNEDLVNMLYQANEFLALNADRILELSTEPKENALEAKYVEKLSEDAMELSAWIEKLSNEELVGDFEFCYTENQNELHWKVAPFSAPVSSADTELNNKPSSVSNESEQVLNNEGAQAQSNDETKVPSSGQSPADNVASSESVLDENDRTAEPDSATLPDSGESETDTTETEAALVENKIDNNSKAEPKAVVNESEESSTLASETDSDQEQTHEPVNMESELEDDMTTVKDYIEDNLSDSFITEVASGWYQAPGIGTFYDAGNGWIYEPNLGWSFLKTCPSNCSAWLFNENLGWLWFDAELPNMAFANNNGSPSWIFYPENTFGQSDLVFDYTQNSWMEWK